MYTLLVGLIALIALLLCLVILLQSGKGGGLAGIAAGDSTSQLLGARQAPDVLEKATWVLSTSFIVLCILSNFFVPSSEAAESVIQTQQTQQSAPAQQSPLPAPAPIQQQEQPPAETPPDGGSGN